MALDKITEAIAHFIGLFETITDTMRIRDTYGSFEASRREDTIHDEAREPVKSTPEHYDLQGFKPTLDYTPPPVPVDKLKAEAKVVYEPPHVKPGGAASTDPISRTVDANSSSEAETTFTPPELAPHGSYAAVINQKTVLIDDDYLSLGGSGLSMIESPFQPGPELLALVKEAQSFSPFSALEPPSAQEDIATVAMKAWHAMREAVEAPPQVNAAVHAGPVLGGTFVNGREVAQSPKLSDYRQEEEASSSVYGPQPGKGNGLLDPSVEFQGGSNKLVNEAVIRNDWLAGPVIAGMGDSYEINAIIQTNAWWDQDLVSEQASSWSGIKNTTQAFNLANIERVDPSSSTGSDAAAPASGHFPQYWAVSRVEGDLVLLNWIEQFNFMSDNDTAVLASSGVKSTVLAGGNTQLNGVSVAELGLYYDLIVVGGNIYDCNVIQQTNVLLDNDLIGASDGFQTTGNGSISTSGNLLWNQAQITNVGAYDRFEAMPAAYRTTADSFSSGSLQIDREVLNDSAFEGLPYLRILYVEGDLLDMQFIKQTNVLGDADQIALAMNALAPRMDADWTIATGGNELLNFASIVDVDAAGKTYLAGNHYSQELLVQAEFISSKPHLGGQNPDALVNEAVAFLDDDMLADKAGDSPAGHLHINDGTHADVMQTMLA